MLAMAGLNTRGGAEMAAWAANDSVKTATIAGRPAPQSVIDEVIWVVGDEPILKSEVEITRLQSEAEGIKWDGDPDCQIPEQIAVQKLFLHQAALDSIEVTESEINQAVDQQINYWLSLPTIDGSRERLEQYQRKTISQMRQDMHDDFRDRQLVQKEQQELVKDIEETFGVSAAAPVAVAAAAAPAFAVGAAAAAARALFLDLGACFGGMGVPVVLLCQV